MYFILDNLYLYLSKQRKKLLLMLALLESFVCSEMGYNRYSIVREIFFRDIEQFTFLIICSDPPVKNEPRQQLDVMKNLVSDIHHSLKRRYDKN